MIRLEIPPNADEATAELCRKYWSLNQQLGFVYSGKVLAEEAALSSSRLPTFVAKNSQAYTSAIKCGDCGADYPLNSRSEFKDLFRWQRRPWKCVTCAEKETRERQRADSIMREAIQEKIRSVCDLSRRNPLLVSDLTLEEAVQLLTVFRACASEDMSEACSLDQADDPLAPTPELELEIVKGLFHKNLLFIHPSSSPDAFDFNQGASNYFPRKVKWAFPIGLDGESFQVLEELERIAREQSYPPSWLEQVPALWNKIALHECLQFLNHAMSTHELPSKPGPKTHLVLSNMLWEFSVAQMYCLIWKSAEKGAAFYMRKHVSKSHAANTVIGEIQRQADLYKSNGWNVFSYRRNYQYPQTMISRVLFGSILQMGDSGFSKSIKETALLLGFELPEPTGDDLTT